MRQEPKVRTLEFDKAYLEIMESAMCAAVGGLPFEQTFKGLTEIECPSVEIDTEQMAIFFIAVMGRITDDHRGAMEKVGETIVKTARGEIQHVQINEEEK